MPGVTVSGSPYPSVESVLQLARVRINDCALSVDGDLLADDQPYTPIILNSAWRWLQTKATLAGIETFIREVTISGFPASNDLTQQSWLGWGGSGAGGNQFTTPALPSDLILPLNVWTDSGDGLLYELSQTDAGLPVWNDTTTYDWRTDGMYFYGQMNPINIRIRYSAVREDLQIGQNQVPMMFCQDALSARIAFEFANPRGAAQAPAMQQMAEDAFQLIAQRTGKRNQRRSIRRKPFSGGDGMYPNPWPVIN